MMPKEFSPRILQKNQGDFFSEYLAIAAFIAVEPIGITTVAH